MYHVHSLHFGASHEDNAVLGQFYAEVVSTFTHPENAPVELRRRHQTNFIRDH